MGFLGDFNTQIVLDILSTRTPLHEFNQIDLVLIPKNKCPTTSTDFRLIGLCNTIYKNYF